MTPRQKAIIKNEFFLLWKNDFGDVEKKLEYAHQALKLKKTVYGLPNNEIRNAHSDAREALDARSFKTAIHKLAFARRHLYRARLMYLAAAVYGLEKLIFQWLKNAPKPNDAEAKDLRRRAREIRAVRLHMPKLRKPSEGGTLDQVNKKNLRLHSECINWGVLFYDALRIYDQLTD
jgi:hypothetical protein